MPAFFFIFVFALIVGIAIYSLWQNDKTKQNLSKILPGASGIPFSGQSSANYQGVDYSYQYFPGSRNSPPFFKVSIPFKSDGEFCVVKESRADVFFKKLGIDREVQTGDCDFDQKYYILSNHPEFASRCFDSPDNRSAVNSVLSLGFTEVKHDGKVIEAKWKNFKSADNLDPSLVNRTLDSLITFSKSIPTNMPRPSIMGYPLWMVRRAAVFAVPSVLAAVGVVLYIWQGVEYKPLDGWNFFIDSLKFSVPSFCIFIWLAALLLRGRSYSHRELYIVFWVSLFGFPSSVYGAEALMNGYQDHAEPMSHTAKIVNKYETHSRNSTTYHIDMISWRAGRQTERITVSPSFYNQVTPNKSYLKIVTRPGALKYEWICSSERMAENPIATNQPLTIEEAYRMVGVPRIPFDVYRSKIDPIESNFLQHFFELIDSATLKRMEAMIKLQAGRNAARSISEFEAMKNRIGQLDTPEKIKPALSLVLEAMEEQKTFLFKWTDSVKRGQAVNVASHPLVKSSSGKLMRAYQELLNLYPNEDEQNKQAYRSHLAALDFV